MNSETNKKFFTICPSIDETSYIALEYEADRQKQILNGERPKSMSRFLTDLILESLRKYEPEVRMNG